MNLFSTLSEARHIIEDWPTALQRVQASFGPELAYRLMLEFNRSADFTHLQWSAKSAVQTFDRAQQTSGFRPSFTCPLMAYSCRLNPCRLPAEGIFDLMNTEEFMIFLVERKANELPPEALAEVFDKLIWCMDDNGLEISAVQRRWLISQDHYLIEVALHMKGACPFESLVDLTGSLDTTAENFPDLRSSIADFREMWVAMGLE